MSKQTSVQIQSQTQQFLSINSYYQLCSQLLQINQQCLKYFPASTQPFQQTFIRLISIPISERSTRQQISLHLTTAYYSTPIFQRQTYLQSHFKSFISKLRQIPPNIKLLLTLQKVSKPIQYASAFLQTHFNQFINNYNLIDSQITPPKQIIHDCTVYIDQIQTKIQIDSSSYQTKRQHEHLTEKHQLQSFMNQKQLLLDHNLAKVIQWKYKSCLICSLFLLEKQTKKISVTFIKLTKTLLKAGLINTEIVVKVYLFCLNSAIKRNQSLNEITEQHVYFQLELNKILHSQTQSQFSPQILRQFHTLTNKIKLKTQKSLFNHKNYQQPITPNNPNNSIFKNYPLTKNNYVIKNNPIVDQSQPSNPSTQKHPPAKTYRPSIKKSTSSHGILHNQFLSKFKPKFHFLIESQSLNKIQQYQLSLRKEKPQPNSDQQLTNKAITFHLQNQSKQTQSNKKIFTFKNQSSHQITLPKDNKNDISLKIKTTQSHSTSTWRRKSSKTPSKIYLSIKDKVSKQVAITAVGLENEMLMAPQFVYEKPKITFQQILNDAGSLQQRQNDTQSTVLHHTVNETYLQKVEIDLEYLCMMNGQFFSLKIRKLPQSTQNFTCLIWSSEYSCALLEFQEQKEFPFKTIKSSIEATDLFFELMQANIKAFKLEPVLKLAMMMKNLNELQSSDQLTYYSQMTCLNIIVQIANYLQPYIYWYFTKRNKINGFILEKRQKILLSDPLKFSINLEFFKKNDFSGCVHLFQTVRNKKGLRQSLVYLSQGRQILSKRLIKVGTSYLIEVASLNPKYIKKFQIGKSMQLIFPVLKIDLRKYSLTDEVLSKERMIIDKAFGKIFRKALKKKSKKLQEENETSQKINMKHIFTNDQCNRILINNLNKNYIEKRLVIKLMNHLGRIKAIQQDKQLKQAEIRRCSQAEPQKQKIIYQKQDHCKLEVRLGLESHPDKPDDTTSALKSWIAFLIQKNKPPHQKPTPKPQPKPQTFAQDLYKNQLIMSQRINKKLKNYNNFLIHIVQNYESSFLVFVLKQYHKKTKLNHHFYSITLLQLYSHVYILLITSTSNLKTWIFYISQKLLRNFDYLTFNTPPQKIPSQFNKSQEIHVSQENNIKIKVKPATSLEYDHLIDQNQSKLSSHLSINSMKSQDIHINRKIELRLFPLIFNDQSQTFQLCFMKTPFYNTVAIRRKHTDLYLTNLSSRSNPFSVSYNVNKVILKKLAKCNPLHSFHAQYIYFACSLDEMLNFWRVDIYRPSNQSKYLVIIPKQFLIEESVTSMDLKKVEQTKEKYTVFWRKIINDRKFQISFNERFFSLNSNKFTLYETFGRMTLPPTVYANESYYERIQNCHRDIYQAAFEGVERRKHPKKVHFSAVNNNSGLAELLKNGQEVTLVLVNYEKRKIFSSDIEENPSHIFENIFSQQQFKESKHFMYQNLFRRLFQKLQRNSIVLNQTSIDHLAFIQQ